MKIFEFLHMIGVEVFFLLVYMLFDLVTDRQILSIMHIDITLEQSAKTKYYSQRKILMTRSDIDIDDYCCNGQDRVDNLLEKDRFLRRELFAKMT